MGILDFLWSGKKTKKEEFSLLETSLEALTVGSVFDFDGETWEVVEIGRYNYGGEIEKDWKIKSATKEGFLNQDEDGIYFFVKVALNGFEPNPLSYLKTHEDLPPQVYYQGKPYQLVFSASAYYETANQKLPVIIWDYEGEKKILELLQWGEDDFELFLGRKVEEWEIENILPLK
jgi:hypothetical protein